MASSQYTNEVFKLINQNNEYISSSLKLELDKHIVRGDLPCYTPTISTFIKKIQKDIRVSDKLMKGCVNEFKSRLSNNQSKLLILSDNTTKFMVMLIIFFITKNQKKDALIANFLLLFKHYSSMLRSRLNKGCDDKYFIQAFNYLSPKHLFVVHGGVLKSISYLNTSLYKKYNQYLTVQRYNADMILKFVYEGRHRLNQSLKSFINAYMLAYKDKANSIDDTIDGLKAVKSSSKELLAEKITQHIYQGEFSTDSIKMANKISRININIIKLLVDNIVEVRYDQIKESYIYLFDKMNLNIIKDRIKLIQYTRKLLSVKYTKQKRYYKLIIKEILDEIMLNDNKIKRYYESVNNNGKYNLLLALAIYLSDFINYIMIRL